MAIDGIFIHYLTNEINSICANERINKIIGVNDTDYIFTLSHHYNLLISLNANDSHMRLTNTISMSCTTNFLTFVKKHFEGGIIKEITQYNNDRIVNFTIESADSLGYLKIYHMIIELTGKYSNMIITSEDYIILEALKKSYPNEKSSDDRIIQSKVKYEFLKTSKINPFTVHEFNPNNNIYEGMSTIFFNELCYQYNEHGISSLGLNNKRIKPTFINNDKHVFYCFDLEHQKGNRITFNNLSDLLDYYYTEVIKQNLVNNEQKRAYNYINKELQKNNHKLEKQQSELANAKDNLKLEQIANVLASNIHLVKPYQSSITVFNFYTNEDITIELNTNISPNENVNYYFNKYKKSKRTIKSLNETIVDTQNDIAYYQCLLQQLNNALSNDLKEILFEIGIKKSPVKKIIPNIIKYIDLKGNIIFVGKNNVQNDYITNTIARSNDYFFHVAGYPGSHVIFQGILDEDAIKLASTIAVYHSKLESTIAVDYVQKKYVKKIKGMKGSFVTYTNQKTTHANGDLEYIKNNTH